MEAEFLDNLLLILRLVQRYKNLRSRSMQSVDSLLGKLRVSDKKNVFDIGSPDESAVSRIVLFPPERRIYLILFRGLYTYTRDLYLFTFLLRLTNNNF